MRRGGCARPGRGRRRRFGIRLRLGRLRLAAHPLHVDAASEVRAIGDGHARRPDVAVDRAVVADVDLFGGRHVADDLAQHDHGLRKHLCLDLAVGPNRQDILPKFDLAFDLPFDGEVLAAVLLAFDDN